MCEHYVRIVQSPRTPCGGGMLKINAAAKRLYSVLDRYLSFIKLTTRRLSFILILSCLTKYKLQLKHITIKTILCVFLLICCKSPVTLIILTTVKYYDELLRKIKQELCHRL